jgi:outer membrane protein assembly factor BamC
MTKDRTPMMPARFLAVATLALLLGGCSWFGSKKTDDYKTAQARVDQPLEVPPELSAPTMDDRYSIPDPRSQTSFSDYSKQTAAGQGTRGPAGAAVLPAVQGVKLERDRDQRWLVVKGEPEKVWPLIRQFWVDSGYPLLRENPEVGIMETEWHEDRSKIPQDFVRRTIGRVIEGLYSSPRRDKFRTRFEKGAEPGTTEVFVSNRAVEEIYTNENQDRTAWQPLPADRELEAEMLSRMMVKLGGEETKVGAATHTAPAGRPAAAAAVAQPRNAVLENSGAGPLVLNDGFDRAWRRVGLALDRVGFTVEDRDRSKGLFFVRYIDPDRDAAASGPKESFWSKLAFWRSPPKSSQPQYRIVVSEAGASSSQVQVQDAKGDLEKSSTGKKILGLLYEQLK